MVHVDQEPGGAVDVRAVVRDELRRAHVEAVQDLSKIARAAVAFYLASLLMYLAVVFLTLMTVYILGTLIEPWIGAAIVGSALLVASIVVGVRVIASARRTFSEL